LKDVVLTRPDLVDSWFQIVDSITPDADRALMLSKSFYIVLCEVLFDIDPSKASALYKRLQSELSGFRIVDSYSDIELLKYALFKANATHEVTKLWDDTLEECTTDLKLFELTLVIQKSGNECWIKDKIDQGLNSTRPFEQARALVLMGFLECEETRERHSVILRDMPESWIRDVAERSFESRNSNKWAKHWFKKFLENEDDTISWASFRLFMKCADRRYWMWKENILKSWEGTATARNRRLMLLGRYENRIKNSIKENEKKFGETFIFEKILKNQVSPWM